MKIRAFLSSVLLLMFVVISPTKADEVPALFRYAQEWQKENETRGSQSGEIDHSATLLQKTSQDQRRLSLQIEKMNQALVRQQQINREMTLRLKSSSASEYDLKQTQNQKEQAVQALDNLKVAYQKLVNQLSAEKNKIMKKLEKTEIQNIKEKKSSVAEKDQDLHVLLKVRTLEAQALSITNEQLKNKVAILKKQTDKNKEDFESIQSKQENEGHQLMAQLEVQQKT